MSRLSHTACAGSGLATIHGILTNKIYIGDSVFNKRDSRTLQQKPV
jgi:site-specific DNA recombinase